MRNSILLDFDNMRVIRRKMMEWDGRVHTHQYEVTPDGMARILRAIHHLPSGETDMYVDLNMRNGQVRKVQVWHGEHH